MNLKTAGEIMIPLDQYPHLPYWFTLRQAIAEMEQFEFDVGGRKSLPRVVLVFDEKYQLLGIVRRRDILRGLEPSFLAGTPVDDRKGLIEMQADAALAEMSLDRLVSGIRERAERPVRDVMLPIVATVDYDDHIMKLIYEMVSHNMHLLPVLRDGSVAGVVRTVDVFHEVGKLLL
jgi:CBS-domain-containing membrane protein